MISFSYISVFGQVNLTNGLVANYNFSGNANDITGNGHNGNLVNGPTLTIDRFGNPNSAYFFDGVDDYIKISDNGAFSTNHISISLWFKTNSDALQNLIGKRKFNDDGTQAGGAQYQFFINYTPFPGIGSNLVGNNNNCTFVSNSSYINTTDVICKSKWYHAVITFDGVSHKIYIDGVLKLSSNTGFNAMLGCDSELRFGAWWAGGTLPYSGIMDDIRWYNRPLNQQEVIALYDNFPTSSSADFSYTQSVCNPKSIQFSNVTPGASTIFWDFGNNTTNNNSQNPSVTYANYGNYTVKLRLQTSSGCKDSVTKIIPVFNQVDSLVSLSDTTICRGNPIQLNTLPSLEVCWENAAGLSSTSVANPVANPQNTITYRLTAKTVGSNLLVNGNFSNGNTGFQTQYVSSANNNAVAQYWIGTNPSSWLASYPACGDHTSGNGNMMMVNASNTLGLQVWQQTISVVPNTNYAFAFWVTSFSSGNPANLKITINGNGIRNVLDANPVNCSWRQYYVTWNSGSNTTATLQLLNNNNSGPFISPYAIDDISFSQVFLKQDSIKITVTDPPTIDVTPDASICPGESIPLTATGAGNFSWSPAGGLSNTGIANPIATPSATTKYIVTGYDLPGCSGKDSVTVSLKQSPVISASNDTSFCTGSGGVVISATAPGAVQYNWTPIAGLSDPTISNPSANPSVTRKYYIEVTGANACKSIDSVNVAVLDVPVVDTRSDTSICEGIQTPLTTTATGATSYIWSPATGLSDPSILSPLASPIQQTKYMLIVSNGACTAKDSVTLDVRSAPVVSTSNDTTICNEGQAQLLATGGTGYVWFPSTGLSNPNISNPVASPGAAMRYFVTVTGSNGCSKTDSINISWQPKPVFSITPLSVAVCSGNSTSLTASGADTYNWFEGGNIESPSASSTVIRPLTAQQYSVAVTHNFCGISDTLHSMITVNDLPVVTVSKSNDIDCSNGSATLSATGGVNYSWTPQTNITAANTANPVVTPAETTTYYVMVTNSAGCEKVDSVTVLVGFNPVTGGYNMPNAFTPNNDGKNDCFGIKYWGVVQNLNFSVYNRWGERIFLTTTDQKCWDGSYKGVPQPSGTYVYQIKATTACGEVFKKGTIILMR